MEDDVLLLSLIQNGQGIIKDASFPIYFANSLHFQVLHSL